MEQIVSKEQPRNVMPVYARVPDDPATAWQEGWQDSRGHLRWTRLFSAGDTATDTFTAGIAKLEPGGFLSPHRHTPAEIYFVLEGQATMTIDGVTRTAGPGTAIFIPGDAEHGVRNEGNIDLHFFYTFAVDRFEDIEYRFSDSPSSTTPR